MLGPRVFDGPGRVAHAVLDVRVVEGRLPHYRVLQLPALDRQLQLEPAAQVGIARLGHAPGHVTGPRPRHEGERERVAQHRRIHAPAHDAIARLLRHGRTRQNRDRHPARRP